MEVRRPELHPSYSDRSQESVPATTNFEQSGYTSLDPDYKPPSNCIGKREIEGEGSCWIFADGTYCRTVVDGEPVNPSWGVTKAGKARKRLAQACLTCREKKIKCEPGFPKCTQCEKTRKVCRRASSHNSSFASSTESLPPSYYILQPPTSTASSPTSSADVPLSTRKRIRIANHDAQEQNTGDDTTDDTTSSRRSIDPHEQDLGNNEKPDSITSGPTLGHLRVSNPALTPSMMNQVHLGLESDPFEIGPELTLHLLDLFFKHVNSAAFSLFGCKSFTRWVTSGKHKCQDELMLLYSVLAAGSVFAPELSIGTRLVDIASHGIRRRLGNFSLQCIQTRQMLGICAFARGRKTEAWDYSGSALRGIASKNYTSEEGIQERDETEWEIPPYGMTVAQMMESRRRTLWSAYTAEQFRSFRGDFPSFLQGEDISTKLPCPDDLFDNGTIPDMPLLDLGTIDENLTKSSGSLGGLGYLVQIGALSAEVWTLVHRSRRRATQDYRHAYEDLSSNLPRRLHDWSASLPSTLRYSTSNLANSNEAGFASLFVSLHTVCHVTTLNLYRYARIDCLEPAIIARNIRRTRETARTVLELFLNVIKIENHNFNAASPGYGLIVAVDVLSAGGRVVDLPALISAFLKTARLLDDLSSFWASAKHQRRLLQRRIEDLARITDGSGPGSLIDNGRYWTVDEPLQAYTSKDCDVIYGVEKEVFIEALLGEQK
ncbi:hypothetical protein EV356DRAFT_454307 [Viridothelium virens]|uniref:Zn(2)-C6 fungal-type domain-containing protein n=1 Tax=Viridothelium virens TaxID=1048519 RepID=A0A6A6GWR4_VIRVR|nr:hypothetical protein EV356DRAFT_454307 [Viridothelium virens]